MDLRISFTLVLFFGLVAGGIVGYNYYPINVDKNNQRILNGMQFDFGNRSDAYRNVEKIESSGQWLCINVKGMTIEDAFRTCQHETAHELFARHCENNITQCIDDLGAVGIK